jgi:hypothetical protein
MTDAASNSGVQRSARRDPEAQSVRSARPLTPDVRRLSLGYKQVHSLTKISLISIGVWWVVLVILFVFPNLLPIVSGFAILISLPVAFALLVLSFIALFKDKKRVWPVVSIALIALVSYLALTQLMRWGAFANLYLNRRHYEATKNSVIAADTDQRDQLCGDECWVMSSDPPRIAFHFIHGFLNWHDIVYDPSGAVVRTKDYDARKRLNVYFGDAQHLTGDWYLCHFGD